MKHNAIKKVLLGIFLLLVIATSHAENLTMARTKQTFPEAMLKLQETIGDLGYTVSRVQRIDIGLTSSGLWARAACRVLMLPLCQRWPLPSD